MNNISCLHVLIIPSWYVNSYNQLSGIFFKEQAEALAKNDIMTGVLSVQSISIKDIWKNKRIDFGFYKENINKVATYQVQYPSPPRLKKIAASLSFILGKRLFKKYLKNNGLPDIIHLHSYTQGKLCMWISKKYDIPYIVTEHSSVFITNSINASDMLYAAKVFKCSSYNMAVSYMFCGELENKYNLQFGYMPNVVNTKYFKPGKKADGVYTFLNVAFLEKNKNQTMLIGAFIQAFKNNKDVRLVIAGDGPCYNNLQKMIYEHQMEKQIILFGQASRTQVLELMQSSNSFVLSSKKETFGVVIIEAMSCGLPVVSTRCGGPENIITDKSYGLLCEQNKDSLSLSMIEVRNNKDKYIPDLIRKYVVDNYSESVVVNKLVNIYQHILE